MVNAGLEPNTNQISIFYVDDDEDLILLGKRFLERTVMLRVETISAAQKAMNSARL